MDDISVTENLIFGIKSHPDEHLEMLFPVWKYHEVNRQAQLRHYDYHHPGGWLPCGDNWWLFPWTEHSVKLAKQRHKDVNARLRAQGYEIYDPQDPE